MDAKTDFSTFIRTELGGPSQLKPCSEGNSCFILISITSGPCFVSYFPSVVFSLYFMAKVLSTVALFKLRYFHVMHLWTTAVKDMQFCKNRRLDSITLMSTPAKIAICHFLPYIDYAVLKTIAPLKCIPYTSSWFWHKPFINTCTDCSVKVIQSQPYKPYTHCHHRCFGGVIPMIASNGLSVCRKRNSLTRRRHRLQEGD